MTTAADHIQTANRIDGANPLVTIVVPSYNHERYIEACIDSVVNQTYSNLEIIVIDDGSTDSSPEILKSLAATYDIFATMLALGGVATPTDRVIDGVDLRPIILPPAPSVVGDDAAAGTIHDCLMQYHAGGKLATATFAFSPHAFARGSIPLPSKIYFGFFWKRFSKCYTEICSTLWWTL